MRSYYNVAMIMTVRLKPETRKLLDRLARSEGVSRSEVVRQSIEALARERSGQGGDQPYEALKHLIGRVRGGPANLSERTGARFREQLRRKKARAR